MSIDAATLDPRAKFTRSQASHASSTKLAETGNFGWISSVAKLRHEQEINGRFLPRAHCSERTGRVRNAAGSQGTAPTDMTIPNGEVELRMMHTAQTEARGTRKGGADRDVNCTGALMRRALPSGGLPNQHEAPSLLGAPTYPASVWETAKANTFGFERIRQGLARGASAARGFSWESGRQDPAGDSFSDRLSRQSSRAIENGTTALRSAVVHVDDYLSRQHGVRPFTTDKRCVLRFAIIRSPAPIRLSDGVSIECGAAVVDLHLWSEHIPLAPKGGPNLAWALQVTDQLKQSLRELARAVARVPEMRDARAFRAQTNFVGRGCSGESLSRIIKRYGFEDVDEGLPSFPARVHDLFENVLIGALVWTHNPEALRRDKLIRERRPVWISRAKLLRLHGGS